MSHESTLRSYFARTINKTPKAKWIANQNIVWKGATADGKPDGYVMSRGNHYGVEFKAGEKENGIYSMDGWRENQRNYYEKVYLESETPYFICVIFWEGRVDIRKARVYLLPAPTYLALERWVFDNTGLATVSSTPEWGIGSRRNFSVQDFLIARPDLPSGSCSWSSGALQIAGLIT